MNFIDDDDEDEPDAPVAPRSRELTVEVLKLLTASLAFAAAVIGLVSKYPENFWLHKFRATFATRCLWAGVDLRTVQQWLGHSDMESTMRYLKPSRSQQTREKVNEIFA
jgi:site-specific recombinase XerD